MKRRRRDDHDGPFSPLPGDNRSKRIQTLEQIKEQKRRERRFARMDEKRRPISHRA